MIALLASIGIGGTFGVVLGVLENPVANTVLTFSFKKLRSIAKGNQLSEEEKVWIKEYNNRTCVVNGVDYTEQMKIINFSSSFR
tara:strand:+ start:885 stop:1136 length:252 start_codon:yes stop_codon:yes gene_type:complete